METVYDPRLGVMVDRRTGLPVGGNYQPPQSVNAFNQVFNGTGVPERVNAFHSMFNPVVGLQEAGGHSVNMLAPGRDPMQRVSDLGQMLTGMAGTVAPMWAASKGAVPAADAIMDGIAGFSAMPHGTGAFLADEFGGALAPAIGDPAAARGAQIMDMLKSGRGSSVTEEMLDMGDPVLNARLNEYMYLNADIPMDEASRMARAKGMGADTETPLYTGSSADFPAFATDRMGQREASFHGKGVYSSAAPDYASEFARGDGGNVMPIVVKRPNEFAWPDASKNFQTDAAAQEFTNRASSAGYSGVRVPMASDTLSDIEAKNFEVVTFDPANIRSRFARFDPRLAHLKNLSASVAGLAALYGVSEEEMNRIMTGQRE